MVNFTCNNTLELESIVEKPIWHGVILHTFGLWFCAILALIATAISGYLILMHGTHYMTPREQKHIIRIVAMIPIYSLVSFLSFCFYRHSVYFQVLRDCYEAFAIASFFTLMCHYIAPNLHDQKDYFRGIQPKNWFLGVFWLQKCTGGENKGILRKPRSGLTWFNVIWVGVFQYCFIRVFFTLISVVTEATGRYCEDSLSPIFAHLWVELFEGASVTVAMFCLIQFYIQLRQDLAEYKPGLKVLCIKLVIFFSFWQTLLISMASSSNGPIKPSPKVHYQDIKVGIPSMLLCAEMAIFAILHLFAFPWKPYSRKSAEADPLQAHGTGYSGGDAVYTGGFLGWRAYTDAWNPWDLIKASARGFRWLVVGSRRPHEDVSYQQQGIGVDGRKLDSYDGITFAGNGESATESRLPDRKLDDDGGDRAGLLSHVQFDPAAPPYQPYHSSPPDHDAAAPPYAPGMAVSTDEGMDLGARPLGPGGYADTGYHGAAAEHSPAGADVHPAFRPQQPPSMNDWDVFGGATGRGRPGTKEDRLI